jgi:hypothetical protein
MFALGSRAHSLISYHLTQASEKVKSSCSMTIFTGEKRGWEDEDEDETAMENYHRRRHEWLYSVQCGLGDRQLEGRSGSTAGQDERAGRTGEAQGDREGVHWKVVWIQRR